MSKDQDRQDGEKDELIDAIDRHLDSVGAAWKRGARGARLREAIDRSAREEGLPTLAPDLKIN